MRDRCEKEPLAAAPARDHAQPGITRRELRGGKKIKNPDQDELAIGFLPDVIAQQTGLKVR